jgi:DNA (cytosine-5)-methyltransferase 1
MRRGCGAVMRGGTLFSGIGAPECAAPFIDWRWAAEIDPFASAVHAHRFPDTVNLGDVTEIDPDAIEPVDLIVFGSPCQSFSVAGKRLGLDDPRGNLALVALALIGRLRPRWVVFENVPGLLSSDEGRDFGIFLGLLGQCGYGFAYRILDAQHFGVPQRRRRVFVVGYLGDWRPAAAVLFEPESLRGDPPPRREAGERVAASLTHGVDGGGKGGYAGRRREDDVNLIAPTLPARKTAAGGGMGTDFDCDGGLIAKSIRGRAQPSHREDSDTYIAVFGGNRQSGEIEVATAVNAHGGPHGRLDFESETFVAHALDAYSAGRATEDGTGRGTPLVAHAHMGSRRQNGVAIGPVCPGGDTSKSYWKEIEVARTLAVENLPYQGTRVAYPNMSVRRLTPRECERLQGFPDNWTAVTYRGKAAADGPRYRALGNSMAVPVVRWILERIVEFARQREAA